MKKLTLIIHQRKNLSIMRIKLDNRIRTIIDNGIVSRHRSMFIIIGDKARDQIVTLHHILLKANGSSHPSVSFKLKMHLHCNFT
jgi:N-acetyltransferase 10